LSDDFVLTTSRIQEAVQRALYADFKIEYSRANRLFDSWLKEILSEYSPEM